MRTVIRLAAAVALAASVIVGFAGGASANTSFDLEVHVRACPTDAVDVFADCHDNPVAGFEFSGYNIDDCTTDADGNCAYAEDQDDAQVIWDPTEAVADVFATYCTADQDGFEYDIDDSGSDVILDLWFVDDVNTSVVCDLYVVDDTLPLAHAGGAELPNTGAGVNEQGANLGLLLAGVVALGGMAVASRRAAVR